MGISKITAGDRTYIDLTSDTVTSSTLLEGSTAHGADGELIEGGGPQPHSHLILPVLVGNGGQA